MKIPQEINNRDVKAVFLDEFETLDDNEYDISLNITKSIYDGCLGFIKSIEARLEFLWMVPCAKSFNRTNFDALKNDFSFLQLSVNFRNSREVVKMTEKNYRRAVDKDNIAMPLENFPKGCTPLKFYSLEEGIKEARKRTKEGILLIDVDDVRDSSEDFKLINERWRVWKRDESDFTENENPYEFLLDGNILIVDRSTCVGFEWPTVVVLDENEFTYENCNPIMRCTTNLIIVKKREHEFSDPDSLISSSYDFPEYDGSPESFGYLETFWLSFSSVESLSSPPMTP